MRDAQHVHQTVLATVQDVLGRDRVELGDDFFVLGGSSLSAAIVVTRLEEGFGCEVPVSLLLENPRLRDFADQLIGVKKDG